MKHWIAWGLAVLFVASGCVKVDAPSDDRIRPYEDSGLSLLQVAARLESAGLPIRVAARDLTDADRFSAASGIELGLECGGQVEPIGLYRFAAGADHEKAVQSIQATERDHRRDYPGFVFHFAFRKNVLLIYDEVDEPCRADLLAAFEGI